MGLRSGPHLRRLLASYPRSLPPPLPPHPPPTDPLPGGRLVGRHGGGGVGWGAISVGPRMCGRGCRWTLSPCCPRYVCVRSSAEEGRSSGGSQGLREDWPGGWVGSTGEPFAVSGYPACSELAVSLLLKGRSHAKGGLPSPQGVGSPPTSFDYDLRSDETTR
ncbi:hypothetical protein GOODEAATRI_027049 [Goodea atripinnis]|uniref:Uncharacterized protein n=1 Tax=Goodea atripinnis TaxID=208336 RepID=A0ABV0NY21_9TELE